MSSNALNASLNEMVLVVNLVERTAGSAPDNGSQSLVGKELADKVEEISSGKACFLEKGNRGAL